MTIEKMNDFFTARVNEYDNHMLNGDFGCKEAYIEVARLLPSDITTLLDLGCGTGLELHEIFKRYPSIEVTGIDLTQAMLDKLKEKYYNRKIKLICENYLDYELGEEEFDVALSFQTMHHFSHNEKIKLYKRLNKALKVGSKYIECDYMVVEQKEEDFFFAENQRIRREQGVSEDEFYHYDTPCTIENQINMLLTSGFTDVQKVWRKECTTIIIAAK